MKTINVLHVTKFGNGMGGMEVRIIEFLRQKTPGFNFSLFSFHPIPPIWRDKVEQLGIPFSQSMSKGSTIELVKFIHKNRFDIAHIHHLWPEVVLELKKAGIPVIIQHDHYSIWGLPSEVKKYLQYQELVDGVITVSEAGRQMFLQRLNYDPAKIKTIHNGVDFERLKPTKPVRRPNGKKVICAVCRLAPEKGVESLIKAVPEVIKKYKNVEFWIIGGGSAENSLKKLVTSMKLQKYVKFQGQRDTINNYLASTDIFVLPSVREPFSGSLLEAAYCGIPAIAANIDGNADIIVNKDTGILINPTIPVKFSKQKWIHCVINGKTRKVQKPKLLAPLTLANIIIQLLQQPALCRRMGQNAHLHALKHFNLNRYRNDLIDYYIKQLTKKRIICR